MADINTPQVVRLANERARPLADAADTLYQTCKRFQQEWAAVIGTTPINSTATPIADGSAQDGRKRCTDSQLNGMKTLADALVTWFEGGSPTRIAQIQMVAVNGEPRF